MSKDGIPDGWEGSRSKASLDKARSKILSPGALKTMKDYEEAKNSGADAKIKAQTQGLTHSQKPLPKSDEAYLNERVNTITKKEEPPKKPGFFASLKENIKEKLMPQDEAEESEEIVYTKPVPEEKSLETAVEKAVDNNVFVPEDETKDKYGNPLPDKATKEKILNENKYTQFGQDKKSCEPLKKDSNFITKTPRGQLVLKDLLKQMGIDEKECTEKPREPGEILMNENDVDVMKREMTVSRLMKSYAHRAKEINMMYRTMKEINAKYSGIESILEMSGNAFEDLSKMEGARMDYSEAEKKIDDIVNNLAAIFDIYTHKEKINSAFVSKLKKKIYDKIGNKSDDELKKLSGYLAERSKLDKDKNFDLYKTAENKIEAIVGTEKMNDDVLNCVYNLIIAKEEFEKGNFDAKKMAENNKNGSENRYSSYSAVFEGLKDYIRAASNNNSHSEDFSELQKLIVADERLIGTIKANQGYSGIVTSHTELQQKEIYDNIATLYGIEHITKDS